MATRVTDVARRERLNLKKKRDCSQSSLLTTMDENTFIN